MMLMSVSGSMSISEESMSCFDNKYIRTIGESGGGWGVREVEDGKGENLNCRRPGVVISNNNKINVDESEGRRKGENSMCRRPAVVMVMIWWSVLKKEEGR